MTTSDLLPLTTPASKRGQGLVLQEPAGLPTRWTVVPCPIGELLLVGDGEVLQELWILSDPSQVPPRVASSLVHDPAAFAEVERQLQAYFGGELRTFDVAIAPRGTRFQRRVWQALVTIPYGSTITYGALATRIGRPDRARAVGAANGRNPIPIVIPCHRVIGTRGDLVGYGGGLERKAALLSLERSGRLPLAQASAWWGQASPWWGEDT